MKTRLKHVSSIQIGFQTRDKVSSNILALFPSLKIIQIKDLDFDGKFRDKVIESGQMVPYLWQKDLTPFSPPGNVERYRVRENDVLFLSRGRGTIAIPVVEPVSNAIASYYFYIVRPDTSRVLPRYLAWYINQPVAQNYLAMFQHGSHMQMVPKAFFEELEVDIPPMAVQQAIIELEKLRQKEDLITRKLIKARQRLISGLCMHHIQETSMKENHISGEVSNG